MRAVRRLAWKNLGGNCGWQFMVVPTEWQKNQNSRCMKAVHDPTERQKNKNSRGVRNKVDPTERRKRHIAYENTVR